MLHRHFPLLLPLICFICGIVANGYFEYSSLFTSISCSTLLLAYLLVAKDLTKSILLHSFFFLLGIAITEATDDLDERFHYASYPASILHIEITSKSTTKKGFRYEARVVKTQSGGHLSLVKGKLLIYTGEEVHLDRYNIYSIPSKYKEIVQFDNPGLFDYGSFLAQKRICHQTYLKSQPDLISIPTNIYTASRKLSTAIEKYFVKTFASEEASSLVNAIFLGNKGSMDGDSRKLFTNNGLAHLLAISGMHVGIIYLIFNFFLRWIRAAWIRKSLILFGVWFYIVLSGLQIPAIRAGFMLSVFLLGQVSDRNVKSLNSIFFAAFVLLAIEPKLLYQVSFQLSFSAMCSILLFFKPINNLVKWDTKWKNNLWQLVSLNIAVQIFVLPISIFYFKQLPTYFFFTSLLSIPFVAIIMWGTMLCLVTSFLGGLGQFCSNLLENLIIFYLALLKAFSELPYSLIENIHISLLQVVAWITASLFLYHTIVRKKKSLALHCIAFLPLITISSTSRIYTSQLSKVIIYDDPKEIVIDYMAGQDTVRFQQDPSYRAYFLKDQKVKSIHKLEEDQIYMIGSTTFSLLNDDSYEHINKVIDICIVRQVPLDNELRARCKVIVIPHKFNAESRDPRFYNIRNQGAYILKL